ncbi:protein canopy 4 [Harpegnathos saltator]|uniref:Protein canopy 4 n=1 Tax=Harpegnathos saltator TaxID=610380 RepID=E2B3W1_HARSA|nr:protein canopy 4 [Harpegnathos saltator]EFN89630.1 Protein canopy 4 [Harpegnathos saltator]
MLLVNCALLLNLLFAWSVFGGPEEEQGVKYANKCEVCKVLAVELEARLDETGKTHDVLEIGYSVDDIIPKKKKDYKKSELRLLESMENVCERILEYNIHKERTDSTRFARGTSQTFKTLHNLVDKGIKVELGIPYELWDKPSVEITTLKTQCEDMLESYEADIEEWYHTHQGNIPLTRYLCTDRVLKEQNDSCLYEKTGSKDEKKKETKKVSSDTENTKDKSVKQEL